MVLHASNFLAYLTELVEKKEEEEGREEEEKKNLRRQQKQQFSRQKSYLIKTVFPSFTSEGSFLFFLFFFETSISKVKRKPTN